MWWELELRGTVRSLQSPACVGAEDVPWLCPPAPQSLTSAPARPSQEPGGQGAWETQPAAGGQRQAGSQPAGNDKARLQDGAVFNKR